MQKGVVFNSGIGYNRVSDEENGMMEWNEMDRMEQLHCIYWDAYKDAYGVRPRGIDTSSWTEEEYKAEFARLDVIVEANHQERLALEAKAITTFEDRVLNLMHSGTSRERVIAWLMDAEGANGDHDYFCFTQGLPYGYFDKKELA